MSASMSRAFMAGIRKWPMQVQPTGCGGRDTTARQSEARRWTRSSTPAASPVGSTATRPLARGHVELRPLVALLAYGHGGGDVGAGAQGAGPDLVHRAAAAEHHAVGGERHAPADVALAHVAG